MTTARLLTGFGHALKSIPLSQLPADAWRAIVGSSYDSSDIIDLYEHVPWLRRAVDHRSSALASMPMSFKRIGAQDELPVGEVPPLLFDLDLSTLLEQLEGWYVLFGAAYIFLRRAPGGIPKGVRGLHPNTMRPEYTDDGDLKAFRRLIGNMQITLTPEEVAYVWAPNRKHEMGPGAAPAIAALAAAGVLKNVDAFAGNYFEQAPIAPTLVELPTTAGEADRERVQNWLTRRMSGVANAFKALAVSSAVKFSQLSMIELGKLAVPELTDKKREDVATALGVPQSIFTSRASTNATAEQDDLHFYDKTVIPQCRRYEPALNRIFKPLGWQMRFREDQLELYQKLSAVQATAAVVPLVARRIITIDEARAKVGYDELTPEQRAEIAPVAAATSGDGTGGAKALPAQQTYGWHVEYGVLKINEIREQLGMPPLDDQDESRLRDLNRKLATLQAARAAGLPISLAVQMVGLDLPGVSTAELENFFASMTPASTPPTPPIEGKSAHAADCQCGACKVARDPAGEARRADRKRFMTVALKRWDEGKFDKAQDFTSEAMGAELDFIKGALANVKVRDDISRVFARADAWEGYP
ncbi:MAG: phage portal protein [Anaerolineae bacterium]|nr:phage portal protein [Anaerolineae bacterium]